MEQLSVFDIFKIGVGPSSSHTLGPWKAATIFAKYLENISFDHFDIHLYGSLSKTGRGHATDKAVQLGLEGYDPKTINTAIINNLLDEIKEDGAILVNGYSIPFDPVRDIIFEDVHHELHPNTLIFRAYSMGVLVCEKTFLSVGGGFVEEYGKEKSLIPERPFTYSINSGEDLLQITEKQGLNISDIVLENELSIRGKETVLSELDAIYQTMIESVYRGCHSDGILPGGLNVSRRARSVSNNLLDVTKDVSSLEKWLNLVKNSTRDFSHINRWISCFALAVNEENAAMGRIVTSPTNGAAGVIPAVLLYYTCFAQGDINGVRRFLLTAGEVGSLFKKGATISAAVGGCQAEIGVSSAMAAAGLTEVQGGDPEQVLMAAEIAMEHHLGLTCDPIGGLVQIPCIERNAMGAMKAITASHLALSSDPRNAKVKFDIVVKTMYDTAKEMNSKYKETSEGGLAFNLPVIMPNC